MGEADTVTITPDELARRLFQLRAADPKFKLFGASTHRYQLNPCVHQNELRKFEAVVGTTLPEHYQDFLLRFGNGGAGSGYGLLSLEQSLDEFGNDPLDGLARPFIPPRSARGMVENRENGMLPLAHMGCGQMWVLIITGTERGTVWAYCSGGDYEPAHIESPEYQPSSTFEQRLEANHRLTDELLANPSRRLCFWGWYDDWLGRATVEILKGNLPMSTNLSSVSLDMSGFGSMTADAKRCRSCAGGRSEGTGGSPCPPFENAP